MNTARLATLDIADSLARLGHPLLAASARGRDTDLAEVLCEVRAIVTDEMRSAEHLSTLHALMLLAAGDDIGAARVLATLRSDECSLGEWRSEVVETALRAGVAL